MATPFLTGNGVSELINLSLSALLDAGDEVLIPAPDYPLWTACVTLAGGTAVHYICDESADWYPDIEDIRRKITNRTKAIVVINPNIPTGALYPRELLEQIAELARLHHLILFSDEIYDRLVMDGEKHVSIASLAPDVFCVTFSGLSKSHMIAGFRIGWMILSGRKSVAKDYIEGINMLSNMRLCSNVPAQSIVQTALGGYQSVERYLEPGGRIYEQREYIYRALNDIPGLSAVKPKAAFYIFPKLDAKKFNIMDDERFALDLLREKKILIVHGSGFNWIHPDHFRVVYLPRMEVLEEAAVSLRLGGYLKQLPQTRFAVGLCVHALRREQSRAEGQHGFHGGFPQIFELRCISRDRLLQIQQAFFPEAKRSQGSKELCEAGEVEQGVLRHVHVLAGGFLLPNSAAPRVPLLVLLHPGDHGP